MSESTSKRKPRTAGGRRKSPAIKRKRLWQMGALFHVCSRFPRKREAPRVDRLASILHSGLVAPARCQDGTVHSDLSIVVNGSDLAYDSMIFLHRFGPQSYIYTICEPGRFAVFVDPALPVITQEDMGRKWIILCQDEVYVRDQIALEHLTGIAIHPADADSILSGLIMDFRRAAVPLYDYDGHILWQPEAEAARRRTASQAAGRC